MSAMEGEGGGLWLEPKGYVLTVNGGTSKATGTDGTDTSNHFKAKDPSGEDGAFLKDIAYYSAWSDVTVTAGAAPEGQIFDHWEVESAMFHWLMHMPRKQALPWQKMMFRFRRYIQQLRQRRKYPQRYLLSQKRRQKFLLSQKHLQRYRMGILMQELQTKSR